MIMLALICLVLSIYSMYLANKNCNLIKENEKLKERIKYDENKEIIDV